MVAEFRMQIQTCGILIQTVTSSSIYVFILPKNLCCIMLMNIYTIERACLNHNNLFNDSHLVFPHAKQLSDGWCV